VLQCVYSRKQDWHTSVQKNLWQNVFYHVGNCVSLCQYGEGFLLVHPKSQAVETKIKAPQWKTQQHWIQII
jgi:hypothetical protein